MRRFYVNYLAEIYYGDGGESLSPRSTVIDIPDLKKDEKENWEQLSRKLEVAIGEQKNHCVNYIYDAESRIIASNS